MTSTPAGRGRGRSRGTPGSGRSCATPGQWPPARKVELGIPLYGRDWAGRGATSPDAASLGAAQAMAQARREGVRARFDPRRRESTYRYRAGGRRHTVWFSGARAVGVRVALARRQGLAGVAFWAPGMEARRTWAVVRARSRG